jgi:polar amino acid transport system substrate-binding protein
VDGFVEQDLEVAAGIRAPMEAFIEEHSGFRLIEPRFMQIQQAVGITRGHATASVEFLRATIEELKASGFIADALRRSNQPSATVPTQ